MAARSLFRKKDALTEEPLKDEFASRAGIGLPDEEDPVLSEGQVFGVMERFAGKRKQAMKDTPEREVETLGIVSPSPSFG